MSRRLFAVCCGLGACVISLSACAGSQPSAPELPRSLTSAVSQVPIAARAAPSQSAAQSVYATLSCPTAGVPLVGDPGVAADYLATCGVNGFKYLLGPAIISGTDITFAQAAPAQSGNAYSIYLKFNAAGTRELASTTQQLSDEWESLTGTGQFAIVLDGVVQSAPAVDNGPITTGEAQITGRYSQIQAQDMATLLDFGMLPTAFRLSQAPPSGTSGLEHLDYQPVGNPAPATEKVRQAIAVLQRRIGALRLSQVTVALATSGGASAPTLVVTCPADDQAQVTDLLGVGVLLFRPVLSTSFPRS
jgi:SecD-like export protein